MRVVMLVARAGMRKCQSGLGRRGGAAAAAETVSVCAYAGLLARKEDALHMLSVVQLDALRW